jgi:hypothetical protein
MGFSAGAGDLGVEVDIDLRVAQHLIQARRPPGQAVPLGDGAQPRLAAADEDRLRVEHRTVVDPVIERNAALLADGEH